MSELLGMSFDGAASPSIHIRGWSEEDEPGPAPTGWGFGWYPKGENAAVVIKDPMPMGDTPLSRVLRDWERFRSTVFLCHIRGAAKRASQENTHPFVRSYARRYWLFAHNGQLDPEKIRALSLGHNPAFEPVGRTDSEHAFCWLLTKMRELEARSLGEVGWPLLHEWLRELNTLGTLNLLLSDGHDLVAYRDTEGFNTLGFIRRKPPHAATKLKNQVVKIDLGDPLDINRTMILFGTTPLCTEGWSPLAPGELLVARRGAVQWSSRAATGEASLPAGPLSEAAPATVATWSETVIPQAAVTGSQAHTTTPRAPLTRETRVEPQPQIGIAVAHRGSPSPSRTQSDSRILEVVHETTYRYQEPVERSTHVFRLQPVHDLHQEVLDHHIEITPRGEITPFEDVFGNQALRARFRQSYRELKLVATSRIRVKKPPVWNADVRTATLPLVWMPWQRQMMQAYLLPPELPATQLRELSEFAMSFVERQDYDLIETLNDINRTIHQDFTYVSKSTSLETTPFDIYINRRGVCQDFANLFICMARLLSLPARYRVGYIHTGADYENQAQSEDSHAWVEIYLPWAGWQGYDPTNGCPANLDHVRVAVGRNYRDATPTSGTIYKGGQGETLSVSVKVRPPKANSSLPAA